MTRYLLQAAVPQGSAAGGSSIQAWLTAVLAHLGGRLESVDCTMGEYDLVMVVEAPDGAAVAALTDLAARTGVFTVRQTLPLIRPEAARAAFLAASSLTWEQDAQFAPGAAAQTFGDAHLTQATPTEAITTSYATPAATVASGAAGVAQPAAATLARGAASAGQVGAGGDRVGSAGEQAAVEPAAAEPMASPAPERPGMLAGTGELPPGSYELVVGRFTRFSDLGAFSQTLQSLPGVRSVITQQFVRGMVSLRVSYDSHIPLVTRLAELRQFKPELRELGPARFEMVLFTTAAQPAPEAQPAPAPAPAPEAAATAQPDVLAEAEAVAARSWSAAEALPAGSLLHSAQLTAQPAHRGVPIGACLVAAAAAVTAAAAGLSVLSL